MPYGLSLSGFGNLTFSALSVIAKGTLSSTASLTKSDYADVTEFKVVFIPLGVRDTSSEEIRPSSSQTATTITMTKPSNADPHLYLVLGR